MSIERTCIACRTRRPQGALWRVRRRSDGQIVAWTLPPRGRSAYVCPTRACFDAAVSRRRFAAAFAKKGPVRVDPGVLFQQLSQHAAPSAAFQRKEG